MKIAVSGGIAVGKSVVMGILKELGAETVCADDINRKLLADPVYIEELSRIFPLAVKDGIVDIKYLRNLIFNDEWARKALNALAHPKILAGINAAADGKELLFVEVPLLSESGAEYGFDAIWAVVAAPDIRLARLTARDRISAESAEKIIAAQKAEDAVPALADKIFENNGDIGELRRAVSEAFYAVK